MVVKTTPKIVSQFFLETDIDFLPNGNLSHLNCSFPNFHAVGIANEVSTVLSMKSP